MRPVRSECSAQECKVVEFDLGRVEDAKEECQVGPHALEEPDMDSGSGGGEDGERVRQLPRPRTPSKSEWERHVAPHMTFRDCVAGKGLERRHQKHPGHDDRYPLVSIDCGYLSGEATPMLVAKDRRTGMVLALPFVRKGAADPHAVEKLAEWVVDTSDHKQRWRISCDAGRRSSKRCKKGRICNHLGNLCAG